MRSAALAVLATLSLAAPAQAALAPPPAVLDFESAAPGPFDSAYYAVAGATLTAPPAFTSCGGGADAVAAAAPLQCGSVIQAGHDSPRSLQVLPGGVLEVRFAAKQASVSMWVASDFGSVTIEAWAGEPGVGEPINAVPISTAADATWATQDRYDGTRTDVGTGSVKVLDRETGKTATVRAGRSYLVKAKLFAARQSS